MNVKHKAAAAGMAACIAVGFTACGGDASWAARSGEDSMTAGTYILSQIEMYYQVSDEYTATVGTSEYEADPAKMSKKIMSADFGGKSGAEVLKSYVDDDVKRFLAAEALFREQGLAFSEAEETLTKNNTQRVWESDPMTIMDGNIVQQDMSAFYEQNGVAQSSVEAYTRNQIKRNMLMDSLYGTEGEREVPDAEFKTYFLDTRARVQYLSFPLVDSSGSPLSEEDAKAMEDKANAYLNRLKGGEAFDSVIAGYLDDLLNGENPPGGADDYEMLISKDSTSPSTAIVTEMMAAPLNDPRLFKEANAIYVMNRMDTMADQEDYEASKPAMVREMKQEEFDGWLLEQGSSLDIQYNDTAIKRYTVDKLNFKMTLVAQ